ncbi:outer membrane protein assembly factor BamE [Jannaschia formosa]|uniref:outer membrane protein assembly factor BamE n=1 Tax=Jannaschia formosa TaxID=2259592 RepID=UPI000E1B8D30|nr:outer membrane protein assembly factor BamE [Jannaschia formosa]TFL19659.1 outer membrane protein assembly factor BamE [Jannaschia formosa]
MARLSIAGLFAMGLGACSATFQNHGYVPDPEMLQEVIVGVDTRDSVESLVGRPSTSGVLEGDNWYFVRSRVRQFAWRAPETVERELVAISFAEDGTVENIERFGLEKGRVVTLSRRVTETSVRDFGLIQQLLRNFGRINVGETLAEDR